MLVYGCLIVSAQYLSGEFVEIDWCGWHDSQVRSKRSYAFLIRFILEHSTQILVGRRCIVLLDVNANHKVLTFAEQPSALQRHHQPDVLVVMTQNYVD